MNGYSLVIDISSDEEYTRTSTPLKSLPLNMVGSLSDSSTEVFRGSDAELESSCGSKGSPRILGLTPKKKKKFTRVSFKLPPVNNGSESDFYEETDTPKRAEPLKPCRKINVQPEREMPRDSPNDLDELSKPPEISREEQEHFERMALELEEEERQITYMTAGRGRGPHQIRNYISRPPVVIKKEIPHCHGLPVSLASRGALSRPAPGRGCSFCYVMGRGRGRRYCKYH